MHIDAKLPRGKDGPDNTLNDRTNIRYHLSSRAQLLPLPDHRNMELTLRRHLSPNRSRQAWPVPAVGRCMRGNAHMMEASKCVICEWLHFARQGCSWPPRINSPRYLCLLCCGQANSSKDTPSRSWPTRTLIRYQSWRRRKDGAGSPATCHSQKRSCAKAPCVQRRGSLWRRGL